VTRKAGQGEGTRPTKRADGRWAVAVTLPGSGARRWFYGKTRKEAVEKLNSALRDVQQGRPLPPGRLTVGEYLERWLETVHRRLRPSTHQSYVSYCHTHLVPRLGRHPLGALQPLDVSQALADMAAGGLSPRTCQYARAILRSALHDPSRWGMLGERNAAALADVPRGPSKEGAALEPAQASILLAAAADQPIGALVAVLLASGLRLGEALGLRWDDVDLERRRLFVRSTLVRVRGQGWLLGPPKSVSGTRIVPLISVALDALRAQHDRQQFDRERAPAAWGDYGAGGFVFTTSVGTPLDGPNALHALKRVLRQAGLPISIRLHDLRHSTATYLLAGGVDPRIVMQIMGWSQVSMLKRYQHVLPAMLTDAADRLQAVFPAAT
jgi:integrase